MNAVRDGWQVASPQPSPPAEVALALQELTARLLGGGLGIAPRHLLLVGASPKVGTTFVAEHWAALLAPMRAEVLVVECREDAADTWTTTPLPAGGAPRGRVTKLCLPWTACLAMCRNGSSAAWQKPFDVVLWDLPALSQSPAALLLARHADGIVLVAQARRTRRDAASESAHRLESAGGKVLGLVLNRTWSFTPRWVLRFL